MPTHHTLHIGIAMMLLLAGLSSPASGQQQPTTYPSYPLTADSMVQPGVPKGELLPPFEFNQSKTFPGTTRMVQVYVPAQYTPDKPACVYVNQDGLQNWNAPIVFDNLIAKKEMPITIGVFVPPGVVKAIDPATALDRFNRSLEYDGLGDAYARFLLEELLPAVENLKTSDGRPIRLSHSGNDRAIGGSSSGAIAAFTAAWERPDGFSRVFSTIGTYVGLRGGDRYPTFVREFEPKPIRVFLQDGSNDQNIYGGDWWMANQMMERALTFAGYEVAHVWGEGPHSTAPGTQGPAVFPDGMRFLWKDWPKPVQAGKSKNAFLSALLIDGQGWEQVTDGYQATQGAAANAKGEVFFSDYGANKTFKIGLDGKVSPFIADAKQIFGQEFGPDGRLYSVSQADQKLYAFAPDGKATTIVEGLRGNDVVVTQNGNVYLSVPPVAERNDPGVVYLIKPNGEKTQVDSGLKFTSGLALSPDHTLLYVADHRSHFVFSYRIKPDGTLENKQEYYHLYVSDRVDKCNAYGMRVDTEGRLYVATPIGLQICDQAGRVNCIIPTPNGKLSSLAFGGEKADTIYVTAGEKIFKRKINATGMPAWKPGIKPTAPRL